MDKEKNLIESLGSEGAVTRLIHRDDYIILEIIREVGLGENEEHKAVFMPKLLDTLKHEPANDSELEMGIAEIEDGLMKIVQLLPARRSLVSSNSEVKKIAAIGGLDLKGRVDLDIDTVEDIFRKLSGVAYGTPSPRFNIPENREFTAMVLVLREVMHHAGYNKVIVIP
jgi:hypothetical protein